MSFPNDMSRIARGIGNLETSATDYANAAGAQAPARSLIRKTYHITEVPSVLANGDNAFNANAAPSIFFKQPVKVLGVTVKTRAALTSNAGNYATLSLRAVSSLGVIGNVIANVATTPTQTGNLVQGQTFNLTVIAGNSRVLANTWVGVNIGQTSSGVAVAATSWAIDVEEEGPDLYAV